MITRRHMATCTLAAGVLLAAATTAVADDTVAGTSRTVVGVVAVAGEESAPTYALAVADGTFVPVTGSGLADAVGRTVTARVTLPGGLRALPGDALDPSSLAVWAEPLEISLVDVAETREEADAAAPRRVFVARIGNLGPSPLSDAQISGVLAGAADYWADESNGRVGGMDLPAGPGDATQWTTYSTALPAGTACQLSENFWSLVNEAKALFPGVVFQGQGADQLVVLKPVQDCSPAPGAVGVGSLGQDFDTGGVSVVLLREGAEGTLVHEWGHHFGLGHSALDTSSDPDGPGLVEYGNLYSVMGYGVPSTTRRTALSSAYRDAVGIDDAGEIESFELPDPRLASSTTRTLRPRSDDAGARGVRIVLPDTGRTVYLDYRAATGQDAGSAYAVGTNLLGWIFAPGVVVEEAFRGFGTQTVLLPAGAFRDPSTGVGESWTAGAITVRVTSATASGADVAIDYRPGAPSGTPAPAVLSGVSEVGGALAVTVPAWDPAPDAITYQWFLDGAALEGETFSSLVLNASHLGRRPSVRVTGHVVGRTPAVTTAVAPLVAPGTLQFSLLPRLLTTQPIVGRPAGRVVAHRGHPCRGGGCLHVDVQRHCDRGGDRT